VSDRTALEVAGTAPVDTTPLTLLQRCFVGATVLAPVDLAVAGSFTVYDVLVVGLLGGILLERRPMIWMPRRFLAPVLVLLMASFVSLTRSTEVIEGLTQTAQFVFIFAVVAPVTMTLVTTKRVLLATVGAFVLGATIVILVARVQNVAGGNDRIVTAFNSNPNPLGYAAAYAIPFVLFGLWTLSRRRRPIVFAVAFATAVYVALWAVTASGSRGAALGLVAAVVVYWLFSDGLELSPTTLRRAAVLGVGIGLVVIALSTWAILPGTLNERVAATASGESTLIDDRARLANAAVLAYEESPLIGTGLDNFRYVARQYDELSTEQAPHNVLLQFLAQTGVFGMLAFVVLIGIWYHYLVRAHRGCRDPRWRRVIWMFVASLSALMVILMTTPNMVHRHYWLVFILGLPAAQFGLREADSPEVQP